MPKRSSSVFTVQFSDGASSEVELFFTNPRVWSVVFHIKISTHSFWLFHQATASIVTKVRPSDRPSVCLSVRMEKHGSQWTDFRGILYLWIFTKISQENSILVKSGRHKTHENLRQLSVFFLGWKELPKHRAEKQNTFFKHVYLAFRPTVSSRALQVVLVPLVYNSAFVVASSCCSQFDLYLLSF